MVNIWDIHNAMNIFNIRNISDKNKNSRWPTSLPPDLLKIFHSKLHKYYVHIPIIIIWQPYIISKPYSYMKAKWQPCMIRVVLHKKAITLLLFKVLYKFAPPLHICIHNYLYTLTLHEDVLGLAWGVDVATACGSMNILCIKSMLVSICTSVNLICTYLLTYACMYVSCMSVKKALAVDLDLDLAKCIYCVHIW